MSKSRHSKEITKVHVLTGVVAFLTTALLLSFAVIPAIAGPLGNPPTQNVSPNFSDVLVDGTVRTDGITSRDESGGDSDPVLVNDADGLDVTKDVTAGRLTVTGAFDAFATPTPTAAFPNGFQSSGDITLNGLSAAINGVKNIAGGPFATDSLIIQAASRSITILNSGIDLNGNVDIDGTLEVGTFVTPRNAYFYGDTDVNATLNVNGHLKANTFGTSYRKDSGVMTVPPGSARAAIVYCDDISHRILSCGHFDSDLANNLDIYENAPTTNGVGGAHGCRVTAFNNGAVNYTIQAKAMCLNPSQ